jgi:hypothetical protein
MKIFPSPNDEKNNNFFKNLFAGSKYIKQMMKKSTRIFQTHLQYQIYQIDDEEKNKNFPNPFVALNLTNR